METVYWICAGVGSVIVLIQFALTLLGMDQDGADADIAGDEGGGGSFLSVLSIRTLSAAVAFFGWGGLAVQSSGAGEYAAFVAALLAGGAALVVVAWLMRQLHELHSEGNLHMENAVGCMATVYLSIPPQYSGAGKVTVALQDRTAEYRAVTAAASQLNTGSAVMVVGVQSGALEVEPINQEGN